MSLWRAFKSVVGGQLVLGLASLAMVGVYITRGARARQVSQEVIGGWAGDMLLRLNELGLRVHRSGPSLQGPVFYMANHSSSLDLPVLMALRLPNTRTFIKERFRWYGTLGSSLMLTGALFTPPQDQHDTRVKGFRDAEELLRESGESVFGSPEGTRVPGLGFGPFNRGVFHLATALKYPIVPILIVIPQKVDPGAGVAAKQPGTIDVHIGQAIDTAEWTLAEIDANKESVRAQLVAWCEEIRP